MAALPGYGGKIEFSGVIGSSVACAGSWTLDANVDTFDVTDFCSTSAYREYITGLKGWTVSVDAKIDGDNAVVPADLGSSATIELYIDSDHYYSGTALLNSWSPTVSVDAEQTQSLGFQGTGELSYT